MGWRKICRITAIVLILWSGVLLELVDNASFPFLLRLPWNEEPVKSGKLSQLTLPLGLSFLAILYEVCSPGEI